MTALLDSLQDGFAALPADLREAQSLGPARREALAAALASGLPGHRDEAWRYTSLRALSQRRFAANDDGAPAALPAVDALAGHRLVFVNGRFDPAQSRLDGLPDGVSLEPLSALIAGGDPRAVAPLARRFERDDEVFARFNAALAVEGAWLRIAEGVQLDAPIHLVFAGAPASADLAVHLRHLVELRRDARACVVEHHLHAGAHRHLANQFMHVHLAPGARLLHARLQAEHEGATLLARSDAVLGAGADYTRADLELGAALSRHELNISLQGHGARATAGGVLLADGRRHLDTRLVVDHIGRDSACDLPWRGLAGDRGRAVFHGGIQIRAGADGSDANLSCKNLLLSEGAEIDAQPVLVIHADEVKAAHGATVGRLDEAGLFYLRSRGLPEATARALLMRAFLHEPLSRLPDDALRASLGAALDRRLGTDGAAA